MSLQVNWSSFTEKCRQGFCTTCKEQVPWLSNKIRPVWVWLVLMQTHKRAHVACRIQRPFLLWNLLKQQALQLSSLKHYLLFALKGCEIWFDNSHNILFSACASIEMSLRQKNGFCSTIPLYIPVQTCWISLWLFFVRLRWTAVSFLPSFLIQI